MTLLYKKIDPVQEFPGNNPSLYFYPFNNLVFRLNPRCISNQENSFQFLIKHVRHLFFLDVT